jgi:tetratricopeptide (TPR) repeat protein
MTLPAVLLLINVYPLRRLDHRSGLLSAMPKRVYMEIAPFAALSAAAMALSLVALHPPEQLGVAQKIAVSAYSLIFYLWKTVAPVSLAPLYPLPLTVDATAPLFLLANGVVVALAALAWRMRRLTPGTVAALVGFGVLVLPMLGIVQNGPQIAADRYTYHASPALALLAGGAFVIVWQRHRIVTAAIAVSLLGTLGALTWKQTEIWRDSYTLWSRALEVSDASPIAHNAMGNVLMGRSSISQALTHFERAVQLDPGMPDAHDNLGVALAKLGRLSESVEQFSRAAALKPESDETHNNWGVVLSMQGDLQGAISHYRQAVAMDPDNANAETNWGNALVRMDSLDVAISHYQRAVRIQPQHAEAHANWGATLARLSRWSEASDQLAIALKLNPDDADARAALERVTLEIQRRSPRGASGKAP